VPLLVIRAMWRVTCLESVLRPCAQSALHSSVLLCLTSSALSVTSSPSPSPSRRHSPHCHHLHTLSSPTSSTASLASSLSGPPPPYLLLCVQVISLWSRMVDQGVLPTQAAAAELFKVTLCVTNHSLSPHLITYIVFCHASYCVQIRYHT
jgi:hypothetical protein